LATDAARITSVRNPAVKLVRSLARASERRTEGAYLAEGVRLITEAIASGQRARLVLFDPESLARSEAGRRIAAALAGWAERAFPATSDVLAAAAQTVTPGGIVAVLSMPDPGQLGSHRRDSLGVILDGVADPGNAGTILRSADAFGVGWVACAPGSVDLFSPKVVRAGMGAHFRLPVYQAVEWEDLAAALPETALIGTDAAAGAPLSTFRWPASSALVIGSEARGLSSEAQAHLAGRVRIPMRTGVESLNASVAASIVMYEASRASLPPDPNRD